MVTRMQKTRIYYQSCPGCGRGYGTTGKDNKVAHETVLGVPGGDYEDYPLRQVNFECEHCGMKFTISLNPDMPEIQAMWEAGEDVG